MGFLGKLGGIAGGIAGAVLGAPLGLLGIGGGAFLGSKVGKAVGGFVEKVGCKAKEVLGNAGGRKGALVGGLAGFVLSGFNPLGALAGAAAGGLIGNKPCHKHHKPCCHHNMGQQYGQNNGACSQGMGYPPMYPGGGMPNMGGYPNMGGMPNMGGYPNMGGMPNMGGYPNMGGMPNMGGYPNMGGMQQGGGMQSQMMMMMMMQQMMQMMQQMQQMGGMQQGGGGCFGGGNNVNININQGHNHMPMFPQMY